MKSASEIMNIAMITDEGYAMPTGVAIYSLKQNRDKSSRYCVYVLCNALTEKTKQRYMSMSEENFEIILMDVTEDAERYKEVVLRKMHVTGTALFKFDLPKYFPELDKLLYVDGDVLIQHDLREVYETDISDVYMAVVEVMKAMTRYQPPILVKLGLDFRQYFHTGMMVMNLNKLREDNMPEKLLDYRTNGINYFMDQDAFNAVADEKVVYLSPLTNYCFTLDNEFTSDDILSYYHIENEPADVRERQKKAYILHLPGALKPWRVDMPYYTELYMSYYKPSPFGEDELALQPMPADENPEKLQKLRSTPPYLNLFHLLSSKRMGINQNEQRKEKITVSLTSFPARIGKVAQTLVPIMQQTLKPDRIVLCLSNQEFPQKENELPEELLKLREHGLEILWGDNLRPHNKYFHTMRKYPDDVIITVDDDIKYTTNLVERLVQSYGKNPRAVNTLRAHLMTFNEEGKLNPYRRWIYQCSAFIGKPLMSLIATGVGGVLYPPHIIKHCDFLNAARIEELCLCADDIWLKCMELLSGVPVVLAAPCKDLEVIEGTQEITLGEENVRGTRNDDYLNAISAHYKEMPKLIGKTVYKEAKKLNYQPRKASSKPATAAAKPAQPAKKGNIFVRAVKKVFPMPVSSFMREINIVKSKQKQMQEKLDFIARQSKRQEELLSQIIEKLRELDR